MNEVVKKIILLLIITFSFSLSVNAQETEKKEVGKICFLRSTGLSGSCSAFKTYIDGELVCELNNKKYSTHEVLVGKHECYVQYGGLKINEKAEKCKIEVQSDRITYVQFFLDNGLLSFRIYGEEITKDSAEKKMKKMKEEIKCF